MFRFRADRSALMNILPHAWQGPAFVVEVLREDGAREKRGYAYKRLPMGTTFPPEIMQAVAQAMANIVQERVFGSRGGARGPKPVVHIENVRFLANTQREARFYAEQWARLCKEISVQCGEEPVNTPHQHGDFLGPACDYEKGVVALAQKAINKLSTPSAQPRAGPSSFALRDVARLFGVCPFGPIPLR